MAAGPFFSAGVTHGRSIFPRQIVVDHGTVSPRFARNVSQMVRKGGGAFLDAPISGGPQGALEGTHVAGISYDY